MRPFQGQSELLEELYHQRSHQWWCGNYLNMGDQTRELDSATLAENGVSTTNLLGRPEEERKISKLVTSQITLI